MTRLLVVDWDIFMPRGFEASTKVQKEMRARGDHPFNYDWGHREAEYFIGPAWLFRASAFLQRGIDLPELTGEQEKFWSQFDFNDDVEVFVGESNSFAVNAEVAGAYGGTDVTEVWLYDAHHDCGYNPAKDPEELVEEGIFDCGSWMAFYWAAGARLYVRYPEWCEWKQREGEMTLPRRAVNRRTASPTNGPKGPIDRVFICRSGAWMPSWHDEAFIEFVNKVPNSDTLTVVKPDVYNPMEPRDFDMEEVRALVEAKETMSDVDALTKKLEAVDD